MKSMSWIWRSLSICWLSGSWWAKCGPCWVAWGAAVFINSCCLVWVCTGVFNWISIKLEVKCMSWIWRSLGVCWLSSSWWAECGPCRVSWSTTVLILSSSLVGVSAVIFYSISSIWWGCIVIVKSLKFFQFFLIGLKVECSSWPEISGIDVVIFHMDLWFQVVNLLWWGIALIIKLNWEFYFKIFSSWFKWEQISWPSKIFRINIEIDLFIFFISLNLSHSKWWLSIPMLSSCSNSKPSLWVNQWLLKCDCTCQAKKCCNCEFH